MRLLFVFFLFSSTSEEAKTSKIWTVQMPFEPCLQVSNFPNNVCKWAIVAGVAWGVAPPCWNQTNFIWLGMYTWLRSNLCCPQTSMAQTFQVIFELFEDLLSISSGFLSPQYNDLQHHSGESGLIRKSNFAYSIRKTIILLLC